MSWFILVPPSNLRAYFTVCRICAAAFMTSATYFSHKKTVAKLHTCPDFPADALIDSTMRAALFQPFLFPCLLGLCAFRCEQVTKSGLWTLIPQPISLIPRAGPAVTFSTICIQTTGTTIHIHYMCTVTVCKSQVSITLSWVSWGLLEMIVRYLTFCPEDGSLRTHWGGVCAEYWHEMYVQWCNMREGVMCCFVQRVEIFTITSSA